MSALASFVSGRRTKWVVIGLWIDDEEPVPA